MNVATTTHNLGDLVVIAPDCDPTGRHNGRIFRITKAPRISREVNYTAEPVAGGRDVKGAADVFAPAGDTPMPATAEIEPAEPLHMGMTVKLDGHGDTTYVVTGERAGRFQLAKLGGDNGRYLTGVRRALLTIAN